MRIESLALRQPETLIADLRGKARGTIVAELAAVVAHLDAMAIVEQVKAALPEYEERAKVAKKAHGKARADADRAGRALESANKALEQHRAQVKKRFEKRTVPMLEGSVFQEYENGPMMRPGHDLTFQEVWNADREKVALELGIQDARRDLERKKIDARIAEGQNVAASERLAALRRHVSVLGSLPEPATPALAAVLGWLGRQADVVREEEPIVLSNR